MYEPREGEGGTQALIKHEGRLFSLALLGLWNRRDELGRTAIFNDLLGGLTLIVEFPMARRISLQRLPRTAT